ncbi:hypothetical protein Bca52824_065830 [Brassica carinata]|uniref:Uncharacterized protein n=1 Tax=Brassica carinata TaxID=52824 RepID=A0A8X7U9I1_BRACI|nr:hypothetical protein Bca52824_065830 [Brassica carinata]
MYPRIRETNIRFTAISFLNQLLQEQLGSSSVAQRRFLKKARRPNKFFAKFQKLTLAHFYMFIALSFSSCCCAGMVDHGEI